MCFKSLAPSLLVLATLSGCSTFQPDYYNCDSKVTSYPEAIRSSLETEVLAQEVEVRLNGVSASCYDNDRGVVAELAIGLKVARKLSEGDGVEPVVVPMAAAVIGRDDEVLETTSFIYTMQFTNGVEVIYPLVRREFTMPQGGRVILSLTPELLAQ